MGVNPRHLQRHLRWGILALSAAGVLYLFWRFDLVRLPEQGCSPLVRFAPGERLIVDRRPGTWSTGDAAFFAGPDGRVHLGRVARSRIGQAGVELWMGGDAPDCPAVGSDTLGWIPPGRARGRILMVWPW